MMNLFYCVHVHNPQLILHHHCGDLTWSKLRKFSGLGSWAAPDIEDFCILWDGRKVWECFPSCPCAPGPLPWKGLEYLVKKFFGYRYTSNIWDDELEFIVVNRAQFPNRFYIK